MAAQHKITARFDGAAPIHKMVSGVNQFHFFTCRTFQPMKTTTQPWSAKHFRMIGVLPVIIFIARLIQYTQIGTPDWILASCHISNLMVGVGMIFGAPLLIRVATIWLIIGLPMWILDAVVTQELWWSSIYSHVGGFLIGLYAIGKARATGRSWLPSLIWFAFCKWLHGIRPRRS
jgi:hypothetical protein